MKKTTNYQLNQWEKTDRIMMDDFNADNAKLDETLAAHAAKLAACGNCKIEYGTYRGTGTIEHSLTFSAKPMAVFIQDGLWGDFCVILRGIEHFLAHSDGAFTRIRCKWTENGATIYQLSASDTARTTLNESGKTYTYAALLPMDE